MSNADLFETVFGPRFRALPRAQQEQVIAAVGCDDAFSCPLALAYETPMGAPLALAHDAPAQKLLSDWDVTLLDAGRFIAWHDAADGAALAQLTAWLRTQMEGAACQ